jgi:hypothetical protein
MECSATGRYRTQEVCACAALVLKFMMMCSARAFLFRIFSTAKSWLKWVLVNLESTVSRT